jgi:recombination protein RecR
LGGVIPLASEEPERHVHLKGLLKRIEADAAKLGLNEVILGLSATTEGDHTRLIIQEKLRPISEGLNFKITSLGRGLSTGSELEYADPDTIASALSSRQ